MENNKIKDKSGDKKYFIMVPKLVWLKARDTYDLTFWATVKDIAGDDGECDITTKNLAVLCMMSVGKVSECRSYWIGIGLLDGQREKNPNERNAIWHLSIPDFWKENIEQAKIFKTQKSRIEFKKKQQLDSKKTVSYSETVTVSPGEIGYSSHETDCTPHETAYLYREKPLEEPVEKPAPENGALAAPIENHKKGKKYKFTETHIKAAKWFYDCLKKPIPNLLPPKKFDAWANDFRLLMDVDGREKKLTVDVVTWLTTSPHKDAQFWLRNVQCPAKLRDKFTTLVLVMNQARKQKANGTNGHAKTNGVAERRPAYFDAFVPPA